MPHELWTNLPSTGVSQFLAIFHAGALSFFLTEVGKGLEGGKMCSQGETCQCSAYVKTGQRCPVSWVDTVSLLVPGLRKQRAVCSPPQLGPLAWGVWDSPSPWTLSFGRGSLSCSGEGYWCLSSWNACFSFAHQKPEDWPLSVLEQWGWQSSQAGHRLCHPCLFRGIHHACPLSRKGIESQPMQTADFSEITHSRQFLDT